MPLQVWGKLRVDNYLWASRETASPPEERLRLATGQASRGQFRDEWAFAMTNRRTAWLAKRSGLRVVYYWWEPGPEFWLFTLFDKDEMADLGPRDRRTLRAMVKAELEAKR